MQLCFVTGILTRNKHPFKSLQDLVCSLSTQSDQYPHVQFPVQLSHTLTSISPSRAKETSSVATTLPFRAYVPGSWLIKVYVYVCTPPGVKTHLIIPLSSLKSRYIGSALTRLSPGCILSYRTYASGGLSTLITIWNSSPGSTKSGTVRDALLPPSPQDTPENTRNPTNTITAPKIFFIIIPHSLRRLSF